jgi:hypothetical protein
MAGAVTAVEESERGCSSGRGALWPADATCGPPDFSGIKVFVGFGRGEEFAAGDCRIGLTLDTPFAAIVFRGPTVARVFPGAVSDVAMMSRLELV